MTLEGSTVVEVRDMNEDELERMGWENFKDWDIPKALVLDSGEVLFPSADEEGNRPGAFFGANVDDPWDIEAFEGQTISHLHGMSEAYMAHLGWTPRGTHRPTCIQFESGDGMYVSHDTERNTYGDLRIIDETCGPEETVQVFFNVKEA